MVLDFCLLPLQNSLREVEVTTGRLGRLRHSAYNTIAIDTRALQNTTKSLGDALAAAPGVKVRETGGVGSDMNVSLDGFSGKHVKVFIDGVPQEASEVRSDSIIYRSILPTHRGVQRRCPGDFRRRRHWWGDQHRHRDATSDGTSTVRMPAVHSTRIRAHSTGIALGSRAGNSK